MSSPQSLRLAIVAGLLAALLTGWRSPSVASAAVRVGSYDNASIADLAKRYVGGPGWYACRDAHASGLNGTRSQAVAPVIKNGHLVSIGDGQCRAFVNCIVWMASNHTQWLGGSYMGALAAKGLEITNVDELAKGDIVQIGNSDSAPGLHTFIVWGRIGSSGNTFDVIDSNGDHRETVLGPRARTVTLNGDERAFQLGTVDRTASLKQRAAGRIVTVPATNTSYVYDGSKLHWIPDVETYWCVRNGQHRSVITATQAEADRLGNGQPWVTACFDPNRVIDKIVREQSSGQAYYVTAGGPLAAAPTVWHPIRDGGTYSCLVSAGAAVVQSNWTQINSLRGANGANEGPAAVCTSTNSGTDPGAPPGGRGVAGRGISMGTPTVTSANAGGPASSTRDGDMLTCQAPAVTASGPYTLHYWWYRSTIHGGAWSGSYTSSIPAGPAHDVAGDDLAYDGSYLWTVALWCVVEADRNDGGGWTWAYSPYVTVMH